MGLLQTIRLAVFVALIVFSLIILGICANYIVFSNGFAGSTIGYGLAISVITLVVVVPAMVIGMVRKGAFTTLVWVELAWVGVLWVLWLAAAGLFTNSFSVIGSCSYYSFYSQTIGSLCYQGQALEAFSWLAWIVTLSYFATLLASALLAQSRGNRQIWHQSVVDAAFTAPAAGNAGQVGTGEGHHQPGTTGAPYLYQQPGMVQQQNTGGSQLYVQPAAQGGYHHPA